MGLMYYVTLVLKWIWDRRDTILELVIILMIGWEIHEGNVQYALLARMNDNTSNTVHAIQTLQDEQKSSFGTMTTGVQNTVLAVQELQKQQQTSISQMKSLNSELQIAAETMKTQLAIVKEEQKQRLAEENKKPQFAILLRGDRVGATFPFLDKVNGTKDFPLVLTNIGDASATNGVLRITSDPSTHFTCDCKTVPWVGDDPEKGIEVSFDLLRPNERIPITLHTQTGYSGRLYFYIDGYSDQVPHQTAVARFAFVAY
jgi:hypothetical protein